MGVDLDRATELLADHYIEQIRAITKGRI